MLTYLSKNDILISLSALSARKEVERMEYIISFVLSVMASVAGNCISKWLDRYDKSDK